jgi:delta 1-pyrroline-5-carboxylate dehydrogenase
MNAPLVFRNTVGGWREPPGSATLRALTPRLAPFTQRNRLLVYIDIACACGATCVLGGRIPSDPLLGEGWFVEPTIFTGFGNEMRIAREEVFGPILAVIPFEDEEEALSIANDTPYGLAAGVWTTDIGRAIRMSEQLAAGTVRVSCYRAISFMAPFGGFKRSGIGRESGQEAIDAYLQTKSVWIDTRGQTANPFVLRWESVRGLHRGLQSFRSMRRMEASLRKASAVRLRFSQSLANRRQRLSQAMVRSTIQRFGRATKPLIRSERLTHLQQCRFLSS